METDGDRQIILRNAIALLGSVRQISAAALVSEKANDLDRVQELLEKRGAILSRIASFRDELARARRILSQNCKELTLLSDIATEIRKSDDIMVEALRGRKAAVERHLLAAVNAVKLRSYSRQD